jgi:hypothetical protein
MSIQRWSSDLGKAVYLFDLWRRQFQMALWKETLALFNTFVIEIFWDFFIS